MKRTIIIPAAALLAPAIVNAPPKPVPVRVCALDELSQSPEGIRKVPLHRRFALPVITYAFAPESRPVRPPSPQSTNRILT